MFEGLANYFSSADFMPHGHCYLWRPGLVWLHVVTDMLIGLSYLSISLTLYVMVRRIRLPFSLMFLAFGVFILACGLTHFFEVWNLWRADYWLSGLVKLVTAGASVATAVYLLPVVPRVQELSNAAQAAERLRLELIEAKSGLEERVRARTVELEAAIGMRDEFLSIASHELRTPITPVKIQLQMALRQINRAVASGATLDAKDFARPLTISLRQVDHLTALVENLLDMSRLQSGRLQLTLDTVDLVELCRQSVEKLGESFRSDGVELTLRAPREPVLVRCDRSRIEQVLTNLLSNAMKYGDRKPVELSVEVGQGQVTVAVTDRGIGIAPEFLDRVFERFERAIDHRSISGMGLGLYIVRQIVMTHEGTHGVESKLEHGSRFWFALPVLKS